ncbi:MAG: HAD family hydrolase, partial [Clostridia bacterium]|nr:HAD family hydrolase [Clostridia bacterium]
MYKAVIFDLDGTLLDSLDDIVVILNRTLEKFGIEQVTREEAMTYIGNGARELVRLAIGVRNFGRLDEILSCYKAAYALSDNSYAKLYGGEESALYTLNKKGVKLAVLTNK